MTAQKILIKCIGGAADGMVVEWYSNDKQNCVRVPEPLPSISSYDLDCYELPEIVDEIFTRHEYSMRVIVLEGVGKRVYLAPAEWTMSEVYNFIFGAQCQP